MEMRMLLILILTAVTLVVGFCLIGFAVKAAKKETVWEQIEDNTSPPTKIDANREAWVSETATNEGLRARAAAAGEGNGRAHM
jgi:hypothetical protein